MDLRPVSLLVLCCLVMPGCRGGARPDSLPGGVPVRTVTPEGLKIEDVVVGSGAACPSGARVEVNFTARLSDGSVFDSSDQRKRPLVIRLGRPGAIRGLREGIPGMRVGGRRVLVIPWSLAYGEQGRDPVPPRTDLLFEIELLKWSVE